MEFIEKEQRYEKFGTALIKDANRLYHLFNKEFKEKKIVVVGDSMSGKTTLI